MDEKAAKRLRFIGYGVVAVCVVLLWLPVVSVYKLEYDDAIASTLAIGIGLLLLSEVGPWIRTLKAGGIEVEFYETTRDHFNALEARVAKLEYKLGSRPQPPAPTSPGTGLAAYEPTRAVPPPRPAPAIDRPVVDKADPQKGRFGGEAKAGDYQLAATFRKISAELVEMTLRVDASAAATVPPGSHVEFHLHDTFDPDIVPIMFTGNHAELKLIVYGGFTVGAWIPHAGIELELDLAKVRGAPRIIRDL